MDERTAKQPSGTAKQPSGPSVDLQAAAATVTDWARVATGFAVLAFQSAQVRRRAWDKHFRSRGAGQRTER